MYKQRLFLITLAILILLWLVCSFVPIPALSESIVVSDVLAPDPTIQLIDPPPTRTVTIVSDRKPVMTVGEKVRLTCELDGFENCALRFLWEYDRGDGNGFQPVEDWDKDYYEFEATRETLSWSWRLTVTYTEIGGAE